MREMLVGAMHKVFLAVVAVLAVAVLAPVFLSLIETLGVS
jgi:hypothetical protein